jgi:hypothetical protein
MSILRIRYANQLAVSEYDLEDQLNLMLGEAAIAKAILGTTTQLDGFECTPTSPASLNVEVAGGTIFSFENVLDSALGVSPTQIPADTAHQILKYAYELDSTPFTITPPATVGNSRNDLIQISFAEADGNPDDIPFFNGFTGQTINPPTFQTLNTQRIDSVTVSRKEGTPAPTGTQTTPAPDAGFVGAWVVTTANGQTTITSGDITEYTGAPFLTEKLKDKISQATADLRYGQITTIQGGGYLYATASGAANTYTASLSPAITAYTTGMVVNVLINTPNTGASTININGVGVANIKLLGSLALLAGELSGLAQLYYDGTQFILLNPSKVAIYAVINGVQSVPAGTTNKFTTDTEIIDPCGFWDSTNNQFLIKRAGTYRLGCGTAFSSTGPFTGVTTFFQNGVSNTRFAELSSSGADTVGGNSFLVPSALNDTLDLFLTAFTNAVNFGVSFQLEFVGT